MCRDLEGGKGRTRGPCAPTRPPRDHDPRPRQLSVEHGRPAAQPWRSGSRNGATRGWAITRPIIARLRHDLLPREPRPSGRRASFP